ncbi:MAG: tRNA (adenosine(37)-N6)-threonylcarbamoyltransferase complex ATPase subunit type 1 TsaE [Candidatus Omnitrophota bacterium]|nr:tRNA (adenosine(37)-N6)-threonylcarbamoyltransferase complex ATPase subunit type 1 TsaE [Candidatus Omnitrophota bacterium]
MKTPTKKLEARSRAATIAAGKKFATTLKPGSIVRLEGDLGAGKTTFVKGMALGLGAKSEDDVKSPTFVIMHIYFKTRIPIYHFDLYRLKSEEDLLAIGFEDFLYDRSAIICIEWAEKAEKVLPLSSHRVSIRIIRENARVITFN